MLAGERSRPQARWPLAATIPTISSAHQPRHVGGEREPQVALRERRVARCAEGMEVAESLLAGRRRRSQDAQLLPGGGVGVSDRRSCSTGASRAGGRLARSARKRANRARLSAIAPASPVARERAGEEAAQLPIFAGLARLLLPAELGEAGSDQA